jgi:hypothetical protein
VALIDKTREQEKRQNEKKSPRREPRDSDPRELEFIQIHTGSKRTQAVNCVYIQPKENTSKRHPYFRTNIDFRILVPADMASL